MHPATAAVVLLTLATTACQRTEARPDPGGGGSAPASLAEAALSQKLDAAIVCINSTSSRVRDAHRRYLDWVAPTGGPDVSLRAVTLGSFASIYCLDELAAATAAKPAVAGLDDAAKGYLTALKAVLPPIRDAGDYYDQERYRDDGLAHGKELHAGLLDAFAAFAAADAALHVEVSTRNRARKEQNLAELERTEGKNLRTMVERSLLVAEDLLALVDAGFDQIDAAAYLAGAETLDKQVGAMAEHAAAHPEEVKDGLSAYSSVESAARDYNKAALALMRRLRDKTPYTPSEVEQLGGQFADGVDGSVPQLFKQYNQLVSRANSHLR